MTNNEETCNAQDSEVALRLRSVLFLKNLESSSCSSARSTRGRQRSFPLSWDVAGRSIDSASNDSPPFTVEPWTIDRSEKLNICCEVFAKVWTNPLRKKVSAKKMCRTGYLTIDRKVAKRRVTGKQRWSTYSADDVPFFSANVVFPGFFGFCKPTLFSWASISLNHLKTSLTWHMIVRYSLFLTPYSLVRFSHRIPHW